MYLLFALGPVSRLGPWHYVGAEIEDLDRRAFEQVFYVDVKSEGLRDILRIILRDVRGLSLREDNVTVQFCSIWSDRSNNGTA